MARNKNMQSSDAQTAKKLRFGLMSRMLLLTVIPIVVILIFVGIFLLMQVQGMMHELKKDDIDAQGNSAAKSVEIYFAPYFTAAEMIADTEVVQNLAAKAGSTPAS